MSRDAHCIVYKMHNTSALPIQWTLNTPQSARRKLNKNTQAHTDIYEHWAHVILKLLLYVHFILYHFHTSYYHHIWPQRKINFHKYTHILHFILFFVSIKWIKCAPQMRRRNWLIKLCIEYWKWVHLILTDCWIQIRIRRSAIISLLVCFYFCSNVNTKHRTHAYILLFLFFFYSRVNRRRLRNSNTYFFSLLFLV